MKKFSFLLTQNASSFNSRNREKYQGIDTDTQWACWEGILGYYKDKEAYLQGQLGNPEGVDSPNKKYYDPRVWLRKGQESMIARLQVAFKELNAIDVL